MHRRLQSGNSNMIEQTKRPVKYINEGLTYKTKMVKSTFMSCKTENYSIDYEP